MKAMFSMLALVAYSVVNFSVSTNCFIFFYQPKFPELKKLKSGDK